LVDAVTVAGSNPASSNTMNSSTVEHYTEDVE